MQLFRTQKDLKVQNQNEPLSGTTTNVAPGMDILWGASGKIVGLEVSTVQRDDQDGVSTDFIVSAVNSAPDSEERTSWINALLYFLKPFRHMVESANQDPSSPAPPYIDALAQYIQELDERIQALRS